jgi:hypothetical protein
MVEQAPFFRVAVRDNAIIEKFVMLCCMLRTSENFNRAVSIHTTPMKFSNRTESTLVILLGFSFIFLSFFLIDRAQSFSHPWRRYECCPSPANKFDHYPIVGTWTLAARAA